MVSHKNYRCALKVDGSEQVPSQRNVDHRDFIDDGDIGVDKVFWATHVCLAVESQESVDGCPTTCSSRLAAFPVGAARTTRSSCFSNMLVTAETVKVLPLPAPPEMTEMEFFKTV